MVEKRLNGILVVVVYHSKKSCTKRMHSINKKLETKIKVLILFNNLSYFIGIHLIVTLLLQCKQKFYVLVDGNGENLN